jgi:Asp-tRNA(Asn)/Glu-tRNA(Gln) amidotransferase A subunit family amidase
MADLHLMSATEAAAAIAAGKLTSEALVEACLERIADREADVGAWAFVESAPALAQARACDKESPRGPLHGVPVGVKDMMDTYDMPTKYGTSIYKANRPIWDAACVALVRKAGGVILGKTVTTEMALRHPARTRNPLNLAHTPGGSSSGSAAGVADGMVPLAFGTQTLGSVIRPAAYCGVVGYKPTYGTINRAGVKSISDELDTIGTFGRSVADAALLAGVVGDRPLTDFSKGVGSAPRIGVPATKHWPQPDAVTLARLEDAKTRLAAKGARIEAVDLPATFDGLAEACDVICGYDAYRSYAYERTTAADQLSPFLTGFLNKAVSIERPTYEAALTLASACRRQADTIFRQVDCLLVPAAGGEAPKGLDSTGDPYLNKVWTLLHLPCVTVPAFTGPTGLPIGAQLVGARNGDAKLLNAAEWVYRALT